MTYFALLNFVFFLSGAAALIFEFLWFHQAAFVFGSSVTAGALVPASFMAGLGLGNLLVARFGYGVQKPIRMYAILELSVALTGVALVVGFPLTTHLFVPLFKIVSSSFWLNALRTILAFVLLLAPSTAMGATLPLLVKAGRLHQAEFGSVLGSLYGWNTMGAVVGLAVCETVLLEACGIWGTSLVAAIFNILAALLALYASRHWEHADTGAPPHRAHAVTSTHASTPLPMLIPQAVWPLLFATALCGFILMALEVVWFRFLLLFFSAHDANFSMMLGIVLAGIAVGGWVGAVWLRRRPDAWLHVPMILLLNATLVLGLYALFSIFLHRQPLVDNIYYYLMQCALPLIFPVACCSGLIYTLMGKAVHHHIPDDTRSSGWLTCCNTMGSALGGLLGLLLLLPEFGLEASFLLLAGLYALTGWTLSCMRRSGAFPLRQVIAGSLCYATAACFFPVGLINMYQAFPCKRFLHSSPPELRVIVKEGVCATIQYLRKYFLGKPLFYRLITNNHPMSGTNMRSRRYMKAYVYWPTAVLGTPRKALLICYGCGCTAKALTDTKSLEQIDIVDISRDIVEMSSVPYPEATDNPVNDERVRVHIEDGRFFLQCTDQTYDIITAEPPPPTYSGIHKLYSREFFDLVAKRLAPEGILTYWLPVYQLDVPETKAIIQAFLQAFPRASLWTGAGQDWMLVGFNGTIPQADPTQIRRQWEDPDLATELRRVGLPTPESMIALFLADAPVLKTWVGDTPPLCDNFPRRIKHRLDGNPLPEYDRFMQAAHSLTNFLNSTLMTELWPDEFRDKVIPWFRSRELVDFHLRPTTGWQIPIAYFQRCMTDPTAAHVLPWLLHSNQDYFRILESTCSPDVLQGAVLSDNYETYVQLAAYFAAQAVATNNAQTRRHAQDLAQRYLEKAAAPFPDSDFAAYCKKLRMELLRYMQEPAQEL